MIAGAAVRFGEVVEDDGLDAAQRAAVRADASALLVVAGPGSGKTRVLTHRIAWRVAAEEIQARHAVAVTFTRRAARELRQRLRRLDIHDMGPVGTFHSIALAQLRQHDTDHGRAERRVLPSRAALSSDLAEHLQRTFGPRPPITVAAALGEIDWAKANDLSVAQYRDGPAHRRAARRVAAGPAGAAGPAAAAEAAAELYQCFERIKSQRRLLDFDDVLSECSRLLRSDEHFGAARRWLHRHFFVDEFQDLNRLQWRLLWEWLGGADAVASGASDICAVGDADQAIYSWNGADSRYLADFEQHFDTAQTIRLQLNYRSHPSLVAAAGSVIAHHNDSSHRPAADTEVQAADSETQPLSGDHAQAPARPHDTGPVPTVTAFDDPEAEAAGVAAWLAQRCGGRTRWSDFGVLARTNAQLDEIAAALEQRGIPYRVGGQPRRFIHQPEVSRLLEHLAATGSGLAVAIADLRAEALAPDDDVAAHAAGLDADAAVGVHRRAPDEQAAAGTADDQRAPVGGSEGASKRALRRIVELADEYLGAGMGATGHPGPPLAASTRAAAARTNQPHRANTSGTTNTAAVSTRRGRAETATSSPSGTARTAAADTRRSRADPLSGARRPGPGLTGQGFVHWVTALAASGSELGGDPIEGNPTSHELRDGAVTLATFHAAKGLQWRHVVLAGIEDGLVPMRRGDPEEQRLFYVAVSRASRTLHLTWARSRPARGSRGSRGSRYRHGADSREPSPWLARIEHATAEPPPLPAQDALSQVRAARAALQATQHPAKARTRTRRRTPTRRGL